MAYGELMSRLSPCDDAFIAGLISGAGTVLDVGCGRGDRLRYLAENGHARLCGVEIDCENAAAARINCPTAEIAECDAASLPYPEDSFDALLCECVFSLVKRPQDAMDGMFRVLRPGGKLILSDLCARTEAPQADPGGGIIGNVYTRGEIERFAVGAGFEIGDFIDRSGDMYAMAAQMILDGTFCDCLTSRTAAELKRLHAGYGVWVLVKPEREENET